MPSLLPDVDPDGLLEYSVVFTDRSLNHMSGRFQDVMHDLSAGLKSVYGADEVAIVPGGGTFAMEAVARQLSASGRRMILRNGWFSYRWSQIAEAAGFGGRTTVLKARQPTPGTQAPFVPAPIDEVVAAIATERPAVVFAPHVETSAGMMLPDAYLRAVADAVHAVGGLFVLDCIASGAVWVDMALTGVDVLISAPQKGWSGTPCAGLVMLSERAVARVEETNSDSFACDLKKWLQIMRAYERGGHAYHATMPTDGLRVFRDALHETQHMGWGAAHHAQVELGARVRALLEGAGFPSVAADGFQAPGVVVSYASEAAVHSGAAFRAQGLQIAAGVPLACDEPADFSTFRIGLFGLDKLKDVDGTVARLERALAAMHG